MTAASCDEKGQHPSRTRCDLSGSTENRLLVYSARDNASRVLAMCEVHGKGVCRVPVRGLPSGSRSRCLSEVQDRAAAPAARLTRSRGRDVELSFWRPPPDPGNRVRDVTVS